MNSSVQFLSAAQRIFFTVSMILFLAAANSALATERQSPAYELQSLERAEVVLAADLFQHSTLSGSDVLMSLNNSDTTNSQTQSVSAQWDVNRYRYHNFAETSERYAQQNHWPLLTLTLQQGDVDVQWGNDYRDN